MMSLMNCCCPGRMTLTRRNLMSCHRKKRSRLTSCCCRWLCLSIPAHQAPQRRETDQPNRARACRQGRGAPGCHASGHMQAARPPAGTIRSAKCQPCRCVGGQPARCGSTVAHGTTDVMGSGRVEAMGAFTALAATPRRPTLYPPHHRTPHARTVPVQMQCFPGWSGRHCWRRPGS